MELKSSLYYNVRSYGCGVKARCGVDVGVALQISGSVARSILIYFVTVFSFPEYTKFF
jgi:hypothetical protein